MEMTATLMMIKTMPVVMFKVFGFALFAITAAMRAKTKVVKTQVIKMVRSGIAQELAMWETDPKSAVKVMMKTLVPTAVLSS